MTYADRSIGEFLDRIASERVTPAGGTALAVAAATGAALVEMACIHADVAPTEAAGGGLSDERDALSVRRQQLLELGERDAAVVDELFGSNEPDPTDPAFRRAVTVPLGIGQTSLQVMELGAQVFETVDAEVAADARAGVYLARAVVLATVYMVRTNLSLSDDASFVDEIEAQVQELERAAERPIEG